jgi:hypothetical protein
MKEKIKLYEDFINHQSDLELGILHYNLAAEILHQYIHDMKAQRQTDAEAAHAKVMAMLQLAQVQFERARQEDLMMLVERFERLVARIFQD